MHILLIRDSVRMCRLWYLIDILLVSFCFHELSRLLCARCDKYLISNRPLHLIWDSLRISFNNVVPCAIVMDMTVIFPMLVCTVVFTRVNIECKEGRITFNLQIETTLKRPSVSLPRGLWSGYKHEA